MLLIGGIWLMCCFVAVLALVPLCRMARLADDADERAVQTAREVHAALQALAGDDGVASGGTPFVAGMAPESRVAPGAEPALRPPLPQPPR